MSQNIYGSFANLLISSKDTQGKTNLQPDSIDIVNGGNLDVGSCSVDNTQILTNARALKNITKLNVDYIQLDDNEISSSEENGHILITPNGSGNVYCAGVVFSGGEIYPSSNVNNLGDNTHPWFESYILISTSNHQVQ